MNRKLLSIAVLGLALFAWQLTPTIITSAKAETEAHDDHGHDEQKDHGHDDGHEHEKTVIYVEQPRQNGPPGHAYGHRTPPGHAKHKHKHKHH